MQGSGEREPMRRLLPILAIVALLAALAASAAGARRGDRRSRPRARLRAAPGGRQVRRRARRAHGRRCRAGVGVRADRAALRAQPATSTTPSPNYVATASAASPRTVVAPRRPRHARTAPPKPPPTAGGWAHQAVGLPRPGKGTATRRSCRPPRAASTRSAPGRTWTQSAGPAAEGVTRRRPRHRHRLPRPRHRFLRSPDFTADQFVPGDDFVDNDRLPLDENGHGTHVAGTIAEKTDNGIGLTGLAYRAKLMPVRVLDRHGRRLRQPRSPRGSASRSPTTPR